MRKPGLLAPPIRDDATVRVATQDTRTCWGKSCDRRKSGTLNAGRVCKNLVSGRECRVVARHRARRIVASMDLRHLVGEEIDPTLAHSRHPAFAHLAASEIHWRPAPGAIAMSWD